MAKIQLLALLFLSVKGGGGQLKFHKDVDRGIVFIEILVGGQIGGIQCFVVV